MKIYTRKGDDGTTGLLFGGRIAKNSVQVELNGAVDETQAFIGLARSSITDTRLNDLCIELERHLWILMAEVGTRRQNRSKLVAGKTLVTESMVSELEDHIDAISELFAMPTEFVIPGENLTSAHLDVARTVARRAERISVEFLRDNVDTHVGSYLNRLSDLLWVLARWQEEYHRSARLHDQSETIEEQD